MGIFLRVLARTYASFGEKYGKVRMPRSTSMTGNWTRTIPSTSFERITAPSLVGERNLGRNLMLGQIYWCKTFPLPVRRILCPLLCFICDHILHTKNLIFGEIWIHRSKEKRNAFIQENDKYIFNDLWFWAR